MWAGRTGKISHSRVSALLTNFLHLTTSLSLTILEFLPVVCALKREGMIISFDSSGIYLWDLSFSLVKNKYSSSFLLQLVEEPGVIYVHALILLGMVISRLIGVHTGKPELSIWLHSDFRTFFNEYRQKWFRIGLPLTFSVLSASDCLSAGTQPTHIHNVIIHHIDFYNQRSSKPLLKVLVENL